MQLLRHSPAQLNPIFAIERFDGEIRRPGPLDCLGENTTPLRAAATTNSHQLVVLLPVRS
jgi:hypothetical protein